MTEPELDFDKLMQHINNTIAVGKRAWQMLQSFARKAHYVDSCEPYGPTRFGRIAWIGMLVLHREKRMIHWDEYDEVDAPDVLAMPHLDEDLSWIDSHPN